MRVLQLTVHYYPNIGGVETHLQDLVTYLTKNKYNVFVLTYRPLAANVKWKSYEVINYGKVLRLPWMAGLFYKLVNHPALEFLYLVPGLFVMTPFILFSQKSDVIHAHGLVAGFVAVFWGRIFNKRVVISSHNIYHFPKLGLYRKFVIWIFSNADIVLCLSQQSVDEIRELGLQKNKVKKFTYWIDTKIFTVITDAKKTLKWQNKFVMLFVGRLVAEKGIRELLSAAKKWDERIQLMIAGIGTLEKEIQNVTKKYKNIHYLGNIQNFDLTIYYNAADILIVPSTHEEGFGRVMLESLACGTPVIASNRGGITEAIDSSVGDLIRVTPKTIKEHVEYYYHHPKRLITKQKKARSFAKRYYSEVNARVISESYREK